MKQSERVQLTTSVRDVVARAGRRKDVLYCGDALAVAKAMRSESVDLIFSSPPYCMGKEYEASSSVKDFVDCHTALVPELVRVLKPGGSLCWQVGYHVDRAQVTPLDFVAHQIFSAQSTLNLRNRIIWTFAHGLHAKRRFSGRHEVVLWYTKGEHKHFDLDAVRVPQKYPGKKAYKGPKKGSLSGNPLGKNPGDVWEIPNVKGWHVEKTDHPCQFPVALPLVFVKSLCTKTSVLFDPFMGVGSSGVAAAHFGCKFVGVEVVKSYARVAAKRVTDERAGLGLFRPMWQPIFVPTAGLSVAKKPDHFRG